MVPRVVGEALTESCGECDLFTCCIEMRGVSDAARTEKSNPFFALLGVQYADRGGGSANVLPYSIRRAIHQMREKHCSKPEMAYENKCVVVGPLDDVVVFITLVSVGFEHSVKFTAYVKICIIDSRIFYKIGGHPIGG